MLQEPQMYSFDGVELPIQMLINHNWKKKVTFLFRNEHVILPA